MTTSPALENRYPLALLFKQWRWRLNFSFFFIMDRFKDGFTFNIIFHNFALKLSKNYNLLWYLYTDIFFFLTQENRMKRKISFQMSALLNFFFYRFLQFIKLYLCVPQSRSRRPNRSGVSEECASANVFPLRIPGYFEFINAARRQHLF